MPSEFQPLVPGAPRGGSPTGRVAGAAESASRFTPLVPGAVAPGSTNPTARPAPPVVSPIPARPASNQAPSASHAGADHKPAVTQVIRDGDRITHIEIRCGCGEIITVECGY